jgi:hypothetical protein
MKAYFLQMLLFVCVFIEYIGELYRQAKETGMKLPWQ